MLVSCVVYCVMCTVLTRSDAVATIHFVRQFFATYVYVSTIQEQRLFRSATPFADV